MSGLRRWASRDGRFYAVLSNDAAERLERLLKAAGNIETGGILIGRYDDAHHIAVIEEVTGPTTDSAAGRTWFVRGTQQLAELLLKRWRRARPTYYLGEWHHHPTLLVEASAEDFDQMTAIAADPAYKCPEPLMLIAGLMPRSGHRAVRAFLIATDQSYELIEHG